ncbi:MAG: C-GCAxxG-C-C family protein [Thermodesulfobacteriota bacterium]
MNRQEMAVNRFMEGHRCSQAVLGAFAPEVGMDADLAGRIAMGLAGGSGVDGECGAVSAAYLVIGLKYGFSHPGDSARFQAVMGKIREFVAAFRKLHGGINCRQLIGLDPFSEEGYREFVARNLKETACRQFVADAVVTLETLL